MTENPGPNPYGPTPDGSHGQNPADPYAQGQHPADPYAPGQHPDPYAQGGYGQPGAQQPGHQPSADPYQQPNPGPSQGYDPYAQQQHAAYGQQPAGTGFAADASAQGKNFFAALFDFSFSTFVTPKIIKIVYIILTAIIGLGLLFFLLTALISGEALAIIGALVIGPIVALFYLAIMRMSLEMYYAVIRLSEDVHQRLPRQ